MEFGACSIAQFISRCGFSKVAELWVEPAFTSFIFLIFLGLGNPLAGGENKHLGEQLIPF